MNLHRDAGFFLPVKTCTQVREGRHFLFFDLLIMFCGMNIKHAIYRTALAWSEQRLGKRLDPIKRELFGNLSGTVLEIGPATGANLAYFPERISYVAVERFFGLRQILEDKLVHFKFEKAATFHGRAEAMPFERNSVDFVVATFVLCTVQDQREILTEVFRVLKHGGHFVFIEHVGASHGTVTHALQRLVKPFTRFIAYGCEPDRDTIDNIRWVGFRPVSYNTLYVPRLALMPIVYGSAHKFGPLEAKHK